MPRVFLSYARADDELFVERLRAHLVEAGIDVWWDRAAMESRGLTFLQEINDAVMGADRLVLVVGPAVARSPYVTAEWSLARRHCIPIVPVLRLGTYDDVPEPLRLQHTVDLRRNAANRRRELVRVLRSSPAPTGSLLGVPTPPDDVIERESLVREIEGLLLADALSPVVITGTGGTASLVGMGGIGKSVLASAFARQCATRSAFPDGIIWLHVGQDFDAISGLRAIELAFASPASHPDLRSARTATAAALESRRALIVVDDVWRQQDLDLVRSVLGPRCRLLATTRDLGLARLSGGSIELDVLDEDDALTLLAWTAGTDRMLLPAVATDVARECGHLPLALVLCGRMVAAGYRWSDLLDALNSADLEYIGVSLPNYLYPDLLRSIDVSVSWLRTTDPNAARCYEALAVFPSSAPVPETVVMRLWTAILDESARAARAALVTLRDRALLDLDGANVVAHDLQWDYLNSQTHDLTELHQTLLRAYAAECADGWFSGPDDGYFHAQLCEHLVRAGRRDEAVALLLDLRWLSAALGALGPARLINVFDRFADEAALVAIQDVLRSAAHVLASKPEQLAAQLLAGLLDLDVNGLRPLLTQAAAWRGGRWLRPVHRVMPKPGQPRLRTLEGHTRDVNSVVFDSTNAYAYSASSDQTVAVWDLRDGTRLATFADHDAIVHQVATLTNNRFVSVGNDGIARIWDRPSRSCQATFDHHLKTGAKSKYAADRTVIAVAAIDQDLVVTSGRDVVLWRVDDLEIVQSWPGADKLLGVSSEHRLLFCRASRALDVLSIGSTDRRQLPLPDDPRAVAITAGGRQIIVLVSDNDGSSLHWFDVSTWRETRTLDVAQRNLDLLALIGDGRSALTDWHQGLLHIDLADGALTTIETGTWVQSISVASDGRHALIGTMDGTIGYLDLERWGRSAANDVTSTVTFVAAGKSPPASVFSLVASRSNAHARLVRWESSSLEVAAHFDVPTDYAVTAIACADDGSRVVTGFANGEIRVFDRDLTLSHTIDSFDDRVAAIACQPNGDKAVACAGQSVVVLDLSSGQVLMQSTGHSDVIATVAISIDGTMVLTGSDDTTAGLWNVERGEMIDVLTGHPKWIDHVRFLGSGAEWALSTSGRLTPSAALWDLVRGGSRWMVRGCSPAAVSFDEQWFAACTHDINRALPVYTFSVWDVAEGRHRWTSPPQPGEISALDFAPDDHFLVSAAGAALQVWSSADGELLTRFDAPQAITNCCLALGRGWIIATTDRGLHGWQIISPYDE